MKVPLFSLGKLDWTFEYSQMSWIFPLTQNEWKKDLAVSIWCKIDLNANFRSESLYLYHIADFAAFQHQSWKRDLLLWCKSNSLPMQMQMQYEVQVKFCTASHQSQSVGGAVQRRSEINPMIQPGPKSPTTCPKLYASPTFWHNFHCNVKVTSRLEICQKIYRTEDFRVKNLHRKRVIFDIC